MPKLHLLIDFASLPTCILSMYFLNKQNTDSAWIIVNILSPRINAEPSPHLITAAYCIIIFITEANSHNPSCTPPRLVMLSIAFFSAIILSMESTNNVTEQNICYILRKQHIIFYLRTKGNINCWDNKVSKN